MEEEVAPWTELKDAQQENRKVPDPPEITGNLWAPSGMEDLNPVFEWAIENSVTPEEAFNSIEALADKYQKPIHQLFKKEEISAYCHTVLLREIEQKILSWASFHLDSFLKNKERQNEIELNKNDILDLTRMLFKHFDPYSDSNRITTTNYTNCLKKSTEK